MGDLIKKAMEEKSIGNNELSIATGPPEKRVSSAEISHLRSGTRKLPNPLILMSIAPRIDISYIDLLEVSGYLPKKEVGWRDLVDITDLPQEGKEAVYSILKAFGKMPKKEQADGA